MFFCFQKQEKACNFRGFVYFPARVEPSGPHRERARMSSMDFPFLFLPVTTSTNAVLKSMAQTGEMLPGAMAAGEQTAGRGRGENAWTSPPGGLYLSVAFPVSDPVLLPMKGPQIAVAVVRWLEMRFGVPARIKWPNDWLVDDRKLGGMLLELVRAPQGTLAVVAGIGMNVQNTPDVPGRRLFPPTSLSDWTDTKGLSIEALARELAGLVLDAAMASPPAENVFAFHRIRSATLGRRVRVALPGGRQVAGRAVDFTPDFRLCVETEAGLVEVQAGDCWHEPEEPGCCEEA